MSKFQKAAIILTSVVFPWLGVQVNQAATPVSESFPVAGVWSKPVGNVDKISPLQSQLSSFDRTQVVAQSTALNLIQQGRGELQIGTRRTRRIERASVIVRPMGSVDLGLTYADGSGTLRFGGRLVARSGDTLTIALTNSGNAYASGEVTVSYGPVVSINSISGSGRLDGRDLTFQFSSGSEDDLGSQPMNLAQTGRGLFTLQGRSNRDINRTLVTVQPDGKTDLILFLADNTEIRFSGELANRDASLFNIRLTSSGMADASGNIRVEYGANNSINNIFGAGKLDNQDFSVQFSR